MASEAAQFKTVVTFNTEGPDQITYKKDGEAEDDTKQGGGFWMRRKGLKGAKNQGSDEGSDSDMIVRDKHKTLDPGPIYARVDKSNKNAEQVPKPEANSEQKDNDKDIAAIGASSPDDYQEFDFDIGENGNQKQGVIDPSALYAAVDKKRPTTNAGAEKTAENETKTKARPPPGSQGLEYAEIHFEEDDAGVPRPIIRQDTMVDYVEINDVLMPQTLKMLEEEDPMYDNLNFDNEGDGPVMPPPRPPPRDSGVPLCVSGKPRMPSFDHEEHASTAEESFSSLPDIPPLPSSPPPPLPKGVVKPPEDPPQGPGAVYAIADHKPKEKKEGILKSKRGESALVLRKDAAGWWCVILGKQTGWVPAEYWQHQPLESKSSKESKDQTPACLLKQNWFLGAMSREECEQLMVREAKQREFVVRESHKGGGVYALSVLHEKKVRHFPIENTEKGFRIGGFDFKDIKRVVDYYQKHALFIENEKGVKLGNPLKKRNSSH